MKRNRLKNIINKSKEFSQVGESPFDSFKKSLPKNINPGDNYRFEAAWKAWGKPSSYEEALWNGFIFQTDENNYKFPSIGYNEETDEYEYLNKGKENETVSKDIRAWDNDVIPFIKELKHGGYVRTFNEEQDCWTYSKNPQKAQNQEGTEVIEQFKQGGKADDYELFLSALPENLRTPTSDYNMKRYWELNGKPKTWYEALNKGMFELNRTDGLWHSGTVAFNEETGEYEFVKSPNHPTIHKEIDWYNSPEGQEFAKQWKLVKPKDGSNYKYVKRTEAFKQGGQMNVIPDGALHARKNHMELADKGEITHKGVPVVDNNGEQQAEVEREEWTLSKGLTEDIERWYKKFFNENTPQKEKDEIAIKCGKRICKELLHNTEDRAGLISQMEAK